MKSMQVMCAKFNEQADRIEIIREVTNDDGTVEYNGLSLPTVRLEWISAEYEIDDVDELAEIAVYESLLPPDDKHPDAQAARLQKRSRLAAAKQRLGPMSPSSNSSNVKSRLQEAGLSDDFINAVDDDTLDVIKRHSKLDKDSIEKKRNYMRSVRRGENVSMKPSPVADRSGSINQEAIAESVVKLPKVQLRGGKRVDK